MDSCSAEAAVSFAVSLLESQPSEVLLLYLDRLEKIITETRKNGRQKPEPPSNMNHLNNIRDSVLQDSSLLGHILGYRGSLAYLHRHYDLIVGISYPRPHDIDKPVPGPFGESIIRSILTETTGKGYHALVNKRWCSLVLGQEGVAHWKASCETVEAKKIRIAECTKDDPTVSWTARLCAMAVCNDVAGLRSSFHDIADKTCGFGAAMKEQGITEYENDDSPHAYGTDEEEDSGYMTSVFQALPSNHPFYHYCKIWSLKGEPAWRQQLEYLVTIAYCAAEAGATDALAFFQEYEGRSFWDMLSDRNGDLFLISLVEHACDHSTLDGPVHSIQKLLMERGNFVQDHATLEEEVLHARHGAALANHLHLAAASNHIGLVQVLLDGGMDPSKPCEYVPHMRADQTSGYKELPLPEDWAHVRGHTEVAELLRKCRKGQRPNNCQMRGHETYKSGSLTTFFPRADRQYGFINEKVFVHLNTLRESSSEGIFSEGFPRPGQKLHFATATDRRGREKAIHVVDGSDKSFLRLPILERYEAEHAWEHYARNGTDESESEEEDDGYGGNYIHDDYDKEEDCYGGDY